MQTELDIEFDKKTTEKQKGKKIKLTKEEEKIGNLIGKKRFEHSRKKGVINKKIGMQTNSFTDEEGMKGELAFCKLFNLFPDFSIFIRSSINDNDTGDALLRNGKVVDVKTTKYASGHLAIAKWKNTSKIDFFALMTGENGEYVFRGFIGREEAVNERFIKNLGHGEGYVISQDQLKELSDL